MTDQSTTQSSELPSAYTLIGPYDKTGYDQGYVSPYQSTDDARPQFIGYATPYSTITIYDGDKIIGTAQADFEGRWTFVPNEPLSDGSHDISFTATTDAGTSAPLHYDYPLIIDTADVPKEQLSIQSAFENGGDRVGYMYDFDNRVVHDSRPTLEGTAKANSLVTIMDGNQVLGTAQTDQWGNWSFTPEIALGHGLHSLSAVVDGQSSASFDIDVEPVRASQVTYLDDNVGNQQGTVSSGSATDDAQPRIMGVAEAYSVVTVYDNGQPIGTAQANYMGAWSFTPDAPLSNGQHHLTAVVVGEAQGTSFAINVDSHASMPAPAIGYAYDSEQQGSVQSGGTTADTTPELFGTAAPGSVVTIYDNGEQVGTATAGSNGWWSFLSPALEQGSHSLIAVMDDQSSTPFVVNIEIPAPVITSANDSEHSGPVHSGDTTGDTNPQLFGTSAPGIKVTIYDNGEQVGVVTADRNGWWSFVLPTLEQGSHSLVAVTVDQSSTPFVINIEAHASMPSPVISYAYDSEHPGAVQNGDTTSDTTPQLFGTATPDSVVTIYDSHSGLVGTAKADGNGSWSFVPPALEQGSHSLFAVVDGQSSAPFVVNIEAHASMPAPVINYAYDSEYYGAMQSGGTTADTTPQLFGTATPNSVVTIYDNGEQVGTATVGSNGWWSFLPPALEQGSHSWVAMAGDQSSTSFVINIEIPAPVIGYAYDSEHYATVQSGDSTGDTTPQLFGTALPNHVVTIYDNGEQIGTAKVDSNGSWWFLPPALEQGSHSLVAVTGDQSSTPFMVNIEAHVMPPPAPMLAITGAEADGTVVSDDGQIGSHPAYLLLYGTGPANTVVTIWEGNTKLGGYWVGNSGYWDVRVPHGDSTNDGVHHYTVRNEANGEVSQSFDLTIGNASTGHDPSTSLSLNDVLGGGEGELFAADHSHDNAQLSLHDVAATAMDSSALNGPSVVTHDTTSLGANLVLPHEQVHAVI